MRLDEFSRYCKKHFITTKILFMIMIVMFSILIILGYMALTKGLNSFAYFLLIIPVIVIATSLYINVKNLKISSFLKKQWSTIQDTPYKKNDVSKIVKKISGKIITFELENKMVINQNWIEAMDDENIKVFDYLGLKSQETVHLIYLLNDDLWLAEKADKTKGIIKSKNFEIRG